MPAGWTPPTTQQLIEGAREVLFARTRRTFTDPMNRPIEHYYTAEVDVYCIMKGQRTPHILNITKVGSLVQLLVTDVRTPRANFLSQNSSWLIFFG